MFQLTLASGHVAPVTDLRDSGRFLTGLVERPDGFKRCVFLDRKGRPHTDPWLAAEAYRMRELEPAPTHLQVVA